MKEKEIKAIVSKMTLEQKAAYTTGKNGWQTKDYPEIGVKPMWMSDGPNGLRKQIDLANTVKSTAFPTACAVAASFNPELAFEEGQAIGEICQAENVQMILGPGVCIKRSPLCGRNFEYYSEDPFLAGKMGTGYVKGVHKAGVGVSLKHYLCNSQETRRMTSSSEVDERTLREIYLPAFEMVVKEAQPDTLMASYNKINGTYATANKYFMTDVLRNEWGYKGAVVSDWGATHDRVGAIKAGTDLTMECQDRTNNEIVEAVKNGTLDVKLLDKCCENVLALATKTLDAHKEGATFDYDKGHQIAKKIEEESIVLLKNDGVLPLKDNKKIAIIGDLAYEMKIGGGGSAAVQSTHVVSVVDALKDKKNVTCCHGYETLAVKVNPELKEEALKNAKEADVAVLFVGQYTVMESEGYDRWDMKLPAVQIDLIQAIKAVQPHLVIVIENGSPLEMPWIDLPEAVLDMYFGGEGAGEAIADVLFGKVNPSGHLPESFPLRLEDNPSYLSFVGEGDIVHYQEGVFVGYRYYETKKAKVLFPFGYGLSYTDFLYSDLKLSSKSFKAGDEIKASVKVKNVGKREGKALVQLYVGVGFNDTDFLRPVRELKGFEKVNLKPGEEKEVEFTLNKRSFACYDVKAKDWKVAGGDYQIQIGKDAHEIVLSAPLHVINEDIPGAREKVTYGTVICDIEKIPEAHPFIDKAIAIMGQVVEKMGLGGDKKTREAMMDIMPKKNTGIEVQILSTLVMLTQGAIKPEEWDEFIKMLNNRK
ncbi:MAG: glycoside hydrolase family 3 C-terminal domain-containing protein [Bacilli bacterium]|jgi:beta-glucosidase|nr:glycoside hydrolase family 3 C-terminal domain-containing protein [Bacilli bacterium]